MRACGLRLWEFDHLLASQRGWFGTRAHRLVEETSPAIDLVDGWPAYEQSRRATSNSVMQSTARKRRKLEREHGPIRLTFDEPDHASLDLILGWKSEQYRRTGRRDRFADRATRTLVHELLDVRDPRFGAPLTVLRAGDQIVAAHFGLRSPSVLAWWFPVYDPRFGAYSPGRILCLEIARAMTAERIQVLDLGKGDEEYKRRLANAEIGLLRGAVARSPRTARIDIIRHWPQERAMSLVLGSPRLRGWARDGLAQIGAARQAIRR